MYTHISKCKNKIKGERKKVKKKKKVQFKFRYVEYCCGFSG
jgi:hypothetical protein